MVNDVRPNLPLSLYSALKEPALLLGHFFSRSLTTEYRE
jgi:hypothetical protein